MSDDTLNGNADDGLDDTPVQPDTTKQELEDKKESLEKDPVVVTRKHAQTEQIFRSFDEKAEELTEMMSGPGEYTENIPEIVKGIIMDKNKETVDWVTNINNAAETTPANAQFTAPLNDPEAEFVQTVDVNGNKLGYELPKVKDIRGQEIVGDRALMLVRNAFNMGAHVRIPLFHSGFWITIKAPGEFQLLELHRQITQDKIELGRSYYGLAFSNQIVFYAGRILDFALDNLHSHSVKTDVDIRTLIHAHDIPIIVWGLASAIWPNGFKFSRACTSDPKGCRHVTTEMINLSKLLWTNASALNAWQKNHMTNKSSSSMTEESVTRYRSELINNQPLIISIVRGSAEIKFTLKVPTANEWVTQGTNWINKIVDSITSSFSETSSVAERNRHTVDAAKASLLRQYSHWVSEIEINTNIVKDRESIEEIMVTLSSQDDIRTEFFKRIQKYIDDSTISIIGVPTYDCPNCGANQADSEKTFPKMVNIIPIDVFNSFFIPLVQRVIKIRNRW